MSRVGFGHRLPRVRCRATRYRTGLYPFIFSSCLSCLLNSDAFWEVWVSGEEGIRSHRHLGHHENRVVTFPQCCMTPCFCPSCPWEQDPAETSQLLLLEFSICLYLVPLVLPLRWQRLVGTLAVVHGTLESTYLSIWIWVQAFLAKRVTSVQFQYGTSAICVMSCVHYVYNTAFLQMP